MLVCNYKPLHSVAPLASLPLAGPSVRDDVGWGFGVEKPFKSRMAYLPVGRLAGGDLKGCCRERQSDTREYSQFMLIQIPYGSFHNFVY